MLPQFKRDQTCTLCDLREGVQSVCIPASLFLKCEQETDQCVLVLGSHPGYEEDAADQNFVGQSGKKLDSFYVHGPSLHAHADIYSANGVRCRPPQASDPTKPQLRACRPYLEDDLRRLSNQYRRVAVLCVGGAAVQTLTGSTITDWSQRQSARLDGYSNVHVFSTFHPAFLLRDPAEEKKVIHVLLGLQEWLVLGEIQQEEQPEIELAPTCPPDFQGPLSIDTETEACLIGHRMTTFHPRKMEVLNGVPKDKLIVTAQIAWREGDKIRTGVFRWGNEKERTSFLSWLSVLFEHRGELWGQNLPYDVKVLRASAPGCTPDWAFSRDLLTTTFLYDDSQERGLKVLAWIYRISEYRDDRKPVGIYKNENDEQLWKYGAKDPWVTMRGIELSRTWTEERFSEHPIAKCKLAPHVAQWYSDQMWASVFMEEGGFTYSLTRLRETHATIGQRFKEVKEEALSLGVLVSGEGSDLFQRAFMVECADAALRINMGRYGKDSPQYGRAKSVVEGLERTDKRDEISIHADNRNQLAGLFPLDDMEGQLYSRKLALLGEAASLEKILTSYTGPLLFGKRIGQDVPKKRVWVGKWGRKRKDGKGHTKSTARMIDRLDHSKAKPLYDQSFRLIRQGDLGWAYPSWYILPKAEDDRGRKGGVRQFRWSCKDPAAQTQPETVFECMTSRWGTLGTLWKIDLAQVEWRMAAFLSGDPVMLKEIQDGYDIHTRTGGRLLGFDLADNLALLSFVHSDYGKRTLCAAPDVEIRTAARSWYDRHDNEDWIFSKKGVFGWLRQEMGKSQNFAELYGGTPLVIQAICRVKAGIEIGLDRVQAWYNWTQNLYARRTEWRSELIEQVVRDGALHLPILGQSRTFGSDEQAIRGLYRPQILDFPVQCCASNLLVAAIIESWKEIQRRNLRSTITLMVHDSLVVDSPADEIDDVQCIVEEHLRANWYLHELQNHVGRIFPMGFEKGLVGK
jgi:DNA polymerase